MKNFDKTKPSTFIQYLDASNLYGWAMSQKLPTHGFKWIDVNKSKVLKLLEKKDTNQGFMFEVDLDYPESLWDSHNDYPLDPENIKIDKIDKLICSFIPKRHYVVHYKNLKQYLKEGIKTGVNKKVIGKFKDEAAGKQITHFVGLRPKLYTFKVEEKGETRKAKGVKKNVIKKSLSFDDYKKCLFTEEEVMKEMNIIISQNHDIFPMTVYKVALSSNDDKRMICPNKIDTLALRSIKIIK